MSSENGFDEVKEQGFSIDEIESLKGIMILGIIISGCSHTSKIRTNGIEILWREYLSQKWGFLGFCFKANQQN